MTCAFVQTVEATPHSRTPPVSLSVGPDAPILQAPPADPQSMLPVGDPLVVVVDATPSL